MCLRDAKLLNRVAGNVFMHCTLDISCLLQVMSYAKKIADATVQNRSQTPFFSWLRRKLLAVDRLDVTPPPGIPGPDGKVGFIDS